MKPGIALQLGLLALLAVGAAPLGCGDSARQGGASEPAGSFVDAFGELDPVERAYKISSALRGLSPDNLPELLEALEVRRMGIVYEEVRLVMIAWGRFDVEGAWEWANQGPKSWRPTLTDQAIYAWGYYDGPGARAIVEGIEDPERSARLRAAMLDGWMRGPDKQGAADYIANFEEVRRRGRLLFLFAGEIMMAKGRDGAMRWVEALPDDAPNEFKLAMFHHIAKMVAVDDARFAAAWFLDHRDQVYTKGVLEGVARRWSQHHDRPELFEYLLSLDAESLREGEIDEAIEAGFRTWMQVDPDTAQAWLDGELPNPRLDIAVVEAVRGTQVQTPEVAIEWARRVDDEAERTAATVRAARRWKEKDPEAFNAWVAGANLDAETLRRIQQAPKSLLEVNPAPNKAAAGKRP